eukprot:SAG22_NODE_2129_length_2969_cov_6.022997_3_plen_43_part_00
MRAAGSQNTVQLYLLYQYSIGTLNLWKSLKILKYLPVIGADL